jgi:hypothetical protein
MRNVHGYIAIGLILALLVGGGWYFSSAQVRPVYAKAPPSVTFDADTDAWTIRVLVPVYNDDGDLEVLEFGCLTRSHGSVDPDALVYALHMKGDATIRQYDIRPKYSSPNGVEFTNRDDHQPALTIPFSFGRLQQMLESPDRKLESLFHFEFRQDSLEVLREFADEVENVMTR